MAPRILVAEDSAVVRAVVAEQLETQHMQVLEAADGDAALTLAAAHSPDVILLDVEMPGRDGYAVLAALKEDAQLCDVPVVFLTARGGSADVVKALEGGAHDFLPKPFQSSELLARVNAALRVKRLHDELRTRNAQLEIVSRTDALTGLYNRRHLDEQLHALSRGAVRREHPLGVLMVDVDEFKRINDEYGHAGGDVVLRRVADMLRGCLRAEDVAGRWGGEEFLVLVPATTSAGARLLAERLRSAVAERPVPLVGAQAVSATVSIGCAAGAGDDPEALVRAADAALFSAKRAGRNTVAVAPA